MLIGRTNAPKSPDEEVERDQAADPGDYVEQAEQHGTRARGPPVCIIARYSWPAGVFGGTREGAQEEQQQQQQQRARRHAEAEAEVSTTPPHPAPNASRVCGFFFFSTLSAWLW